MSATFLAYAILHWNKWAAILESGGWGGVAKTNHSVSETQLPVRHMQTVFPALHHGADDLQVVPENWLLGVEAVLHQELQQPVGEHLVLGVTLDR